MNPTLEVLNSHVSIRRFNGLPVSSEDLEQVLGAAQRGATAGNIQLYSILVIRSSGTLKRLAETCDNQPFIAQASVALLFVADCAKWHAHMEYRGIPESHPAYEPPGIADLALALQDTVIAAQNAVIAAESLGLGTCYVGDIVESYELHRELFRLPRHVLPVTLVLLGHYNGRSSPGERFSPQHVVFDEVYPELSPSFLEAMFAPREKADPDFVRRFYQRKLDAPFFTEMTGSLERYFREWGVGTE